MYYMIKFKFSINSGWLGSIMVIAEFYVPNSRSARFGLKVQRLLEKIKFKVTTRKYIDDTDEFFLKAVRKEKLHDLFGKRPQLEQELERLEKVGCEIYMRNENNGVLFRIMFREFEDEDNYFGKENVFTLKESSLVDFYTSPLFQELVNYVVSKLAKKNIEVIRRVTEQEVSQPQPAQPTYVQEPSPQPEQLPQGYITGITAQQPQSPEYQPYPQQPQPYPYQQPQQAPIQVEYKICPYCGEYNPPTAHFCKRCGSPLP